MQTEPRGLDILGRAEIILYWEWKAKEEEARLHLYTANHHYTIWDSDGEEHGFPCYIMPFAPDLEAGLPRKGDAKTVNVFWSVEGNAQITTSGATLCGYSGGLAYLYTRELTPAERERVNPAAPASNAGEPKRARKKRRNGNKGGRPSCITEAQRSAAVQEIMRRRRDNRNLGRLPACRFYLQELTRLGKSLPIEAERLAQLVKETERPRSGKN